jgi:hypothetical protein
MCLDVCKQTENTRTGCGGGCDRPRKSDRDGREPALGPSNTDS